MAVTDSHPWYVLGARAVQHVWANRGLPYGYACPLCRIIFEPADAANLTREHAPAKSMDGTRICLTCWGCNNYASTALDSHVRRREDNIDFAAGTMPGDRFIDATAQVGDVTARVSLNSQRETGFKIFLSTLQNPPKTGDRVEEAVREITPDRELRINLNLKAVRYDPDGASTGVLRYAYLAAYCLFGYWWAFSPSMAIVRNKIRNPRQEPFRFGVLVPDAAPSTRNIWLVREPVDLRSIGVQIGRELIFLPLDRGDTEFYDRFGDRPGPVFSAEISGLQARWPTEPMHLTDFHGDVLKDIVGTWN